MAAPTVTGYSIATLLGGTEGLAVGSSREALPGSGKSGPAGIESVLEYNGAFLNVRNWIDTYLVTTIGGLDDADVRDSREVNPGYHGETAFKGYYGGRTITLSGKVYAHTLFKLRDMQQGLRQAFAQLDRELPLVFRTNDPNLDMMINCKKSQAIQMADEQRTANHFERPFQIILRASNPRFLSVVKVHSSFNFADLYDFTSPSSPIIKETFDDSGVLGLYNSKGDGFKVQSGNLVSNGKDNITNLIKNPDFDGTITDHPITTVGGRVSKAASGGVDDGAYCVVDADSDKVEVTFMDFPVTAGKYYSVSIWLKAPAGRQLFYDVQWMTASSYWASRPGTPLNIVATGMWQEVKLENIWAIDDPTPSFDTVGARIRVVFTNTVVGEQFGIDKVMFVNGSTLPVGGFFDGSYPLAKWDGNGAAYVNTSTMYPYTILTTGRSYKNPMMTVKTKLAAIDGTHPWSGQDVMPEGFRIVLAYIDDGNQVYVTLKDRAGSNLADFILVVWRNGERETYDDVGLMNMTITTSGLTNDRWWRALMKNGEVVMEKWTVDPASGVTDSLKEYEVWRLTPEQSALFEQAWPMQLVMFDQQYIDTGNVRQDTWRFDEMTYQSVTDLAEWDFIPNTGGILNGTPANYWKSAVYTKSNRLYQLWEGSVFMLRNDLPSLVGDGTITHKIRYDDAIGTQMINFGIIGKYIDSNTFIYAGLNIYNTAIMTIYIATNNSVAGAGGFSNYLDFPKTDFPEDADRWLRLIMNGNTFTVEFWTTDPALGGAAARTRSGTLTGAAIPKMGVGTKGRVGLTLTSAVIPSFFIDDYVISQTSFGDIAVDVYNEGNFRAQPTFELSGPLTNLILTNEANDEMISVPTTIPNGEVWVIDIEDRRMYRKSDEANRFQYLDANSDWMELEPGENPINATVSGTAVASQISVDFHHTVM
jgi:hypothetical protein